MILNLSSTSFRKVTIVGVGLMGGSMGMAIRKHRQAKEVVGLSPKEASLEQAIKLQAIDVGQTDVAKAIQNADLVILATPVESIIKLLPTINKHLKRGAIITDLGSTKAEIIEAAKKLLSFPQFFIGSHPMVGSEKQGVENASADLFEGATCMMTPTKDTHPHAVKRIHQLWTKLGAKVKQLDPDIHDEVLAYVSHLPHMLSFGLISAVPEKYLEHAPQSLKDMTRISASSPQMWHDICLSNSHHVVKSMDETINYLSTIRQAIVQKNSKTLIDFFTAANDKRKKLNHES